MNVFLLGFMGSGKTTIGKLLAKELDLKFIDMDAHLESLEKAPIANVFKQKGEAYFRLLEHQWLEDFDGDNHLISAGGGTPCFENNLDLMQAKDITVYLTLPIKMITQRLFQMKNTRPIIEPYKHDKNQLLAFLTEKLDEREPFYVQADLIFEVSNFNSAKKKLLAVMITKALEKKKKLLQ